MGDRADTDIHDMIQARDSIMRVPTRCAAPRDGVPLYAERAYFGRDRNRNATVDLAGPQGCTRLRMLVDSLGAARIAFLDERGRVSSPTTTSPELRARISLLTPAYLQQEVVLVPETALQAGVAKRLTFHTFQHSPATQLLEDGYAIRTVVQELLGHSDLRTTMNYTHVLNRGRRGIRCRADEGGSHEWRTSTHRRTHTGES